MQIDIIKDGRELTIKDNAGGISDKDDETFELADPPEDTSKLNEFVGMKGRLIGLQINGLYYETIVKT